MIQQTSLLAFQEVRKELGNRQKAVYLCLQDLQSANNTIIARKMHLSINQVTPRVNELRKMGRVVPDCIRECPITHKLTWFWRVK